MSGRASVQPCPDPMLLHDPEMDTHSSFNTHCSRAIGKQCMCCCTSALQ